MGAVANLAPEKFLRIHAAVPFVDALSTILNPTATHRDRVGGVGDPLHDAEVYAYMKSYTPYENVRVHYPPSWPHTSLNDTRVFYVEPAKWIAALRHVATTLNADPAQNEMVGGHGGVSGRLQELARLAFEYAWIMAR
jgi:oligopeptidase B